MSDGFSYSHRCILISAFRMELDKIARDKESIAKETIQTYFKTRLEEMEKLNNATS